MTAFSDQCSVFKTSINDGHLVRLILDAENRAMGSGGYAIEQDRERPGGAIHLTLCQLDYDRSPTHHAFIKDGKVWVTYLNSWLCSVLSNHDLTFTVSKVDNPSFIEDYMRVLMAKC